MIEFATGFVCGAFIVGVVWAMLTRNRVVIVSQKLDGQVEVKETLPAKRPDNKKARYYSSPEYRAEKKYIEEMKKKKNESIS